MTRSCLAVVLAAGDGTRMKSSKSKVLHPVGNLPMIAHVVGAAQAAAVDALAVVVGRDSDAVAEAANSAVPVSTHMQKERLGTAHAVLAARDDIAKGYDDLLVLFGDTPLVSPQTLKQARASLADGADVVVIGFRPDNPHGYGRLIEEHGELLAIREHRDASEEERKITFCNGGMMAVSGRLALELLDAVENDNAKGEYYLTDIVGIARSRGGRVIAIEASAEEVLGVDTRVGLARVEALWQAAKRHDLMTAGVSMTAPETVFLSHDTLIEADAMIEPNVVFGPGVTIASGAIIKSFSHLEGATVAKGCTVGPFARLRPGADLQDKAKVGNFCEVKNAVLGTGAKVNHLTYVGDADIGAGSNIGAGTVTCNYDGFNKHRTIIGEGAFIGSNSSLVAPVEIGSQAYVASGSVITGNVEGDSLAFGRAQQVNKQGLGRKLRERLQADKQRRQKDET
ncbi:bifunctional UDP-N-acetylglucosamine diphosphorylase/glucosamine-1-phosphate N-acetyltransferase GlmU [Hoeflea prorocentri]|uniref:Bifunctional protein GlmU n=1 Tax=Hoeflea prorocentri TaxID=1922333 RepID=A0A9X3UGD6_9HYPH|nr:bifunctional UDP-N-acetylglucosamine diphosphorylase/glucosamine-1-phosphate N-acetyltransferase GlmU [Hoeflea prorocentri]MCY6380792.1 bifunctional UDP-N-acetylglucosamine diphosphorylase/glucosamine-1-phosphate N-acetyltransferase GlmU [Hoeflea prorocentri]MDA5398592.1 bifunctional UDP-N-acetylglucosamine diphosphorylase/glucosamine-1-phosphate N-acetyltransferase GlmU [Hoeflea prorocentri]